MKWLTLEQVMERFQVKDRRTIIDTFAKQGLKFIKVGIQYRFSIEDIEEFENYLKQIQQTKIMEKYPMYSSNKKYKNKTLSLDYEKIRINRELNKVV